MMRLFYLLVVLAILATTASGCARRDYDSEIKELNDRTARLEQTIAGQEAGLKEAQAQAERQAVRVKELEEALKQAQTQGGQQAARIKELESALQLAQGQVSQQQKRIGELENELKKATGALRVRPLLHPGLFYDPEHIERMRQNLSQEPWATAWSGLEARAPGYLDFIPQPIRQPWTVPSPYENATTQDITVQPLEDSSNAMLVLAQYYLFSGDEKYARKATEIASAWTGSLMALESPQAVYEAGWEILVMAMARDMLEGYSGWEAGSKKAFDNWLNERTWHIIGRDTSSNNHRYWIAAQAAAVGVVTNDPGLFEWALAVYKQAIAFDIAPDGHMPQETARGELGIFYQNFAIEALVLVAEIAGRQGIDLWGYNTGGKDLKLAIDYLLHYFDEPGTWPWSRKAQDMSFIDPALGGKKVGWLEMAYYHFKDAEIAEYLKEQRPIFDRRAGGMTTLTHGLLLE